MEVGKYADSPKARDCGEREIVVGDVDPMDRTQGAELDESGKLASIRCRISIHGSYLECNIGRGQLKTLCAQKNAVSMDWQHRCDESSGALTN